MLALINIATAVLFDTQTWLWLAIVILVTISLVGYHYTQNKRVEYRTLEVRVQFMQEEGRRLRASFDNKLREERNRFEKEMQEEREKPNTALTALNGVVVENARLSDEVKELKTAQEETRLAHFKTVEDLKAQLREVIDHRDRVYREARVLEARLSPEGYVSQIPLKPDEFRDAMLRNMRETFGLEDIKDLCFKLDIEFNSLDGGENVNAKTRELLLFATRNNQTKALLQQVMIMRPKTVWPVG